jgi:hypothetical protein
MSQPYPLLRITGSVLADSDVTIEGRDAFTSSSGKAYPARPAQIVREVQLMTAAAFEGTYSDQMQAVLTVRLQRAGEGSLPALAAGEFIDWYVSAFAVTRPGRNGGAPYPVVALNFVCAIEAPAAAARTKAA